MFPNLVYAIFLISKIIFISFKIMFISELLLDPKKNFGMF